MSSVLSMTVEGRNHCKNRAICKSLTLLALRQEGMPNGQQLLNDRHHSLHDVPGISYPAPQRSQLGAVQCLASRKVRIAVTVAAGCSSMSQWPALGMTTSVTLMAALRMTTASLAP